MHLEFTLPGSRPVTARLALEGNVRQADGAPTPGLAIEQWPSSAPISRDEALRLLNDEQERSGTISAPDGTATWTVVGEEREEARLKLAMWLDVVHTLFDPTSDEAPSDEAFLIEQYASDRQCWMTYLDDPAFELAEIVETRRANAFAMTGRAPSRP